MSWRDLTRRLTAGMPVYENGGYTDPPVRVSPWCGIDEQGFAVFRLDMGTQTGTHIDAPSHFAPGGVPLDALDAADLIGRFHALRAADLASSEAIRQALADYDGEGFLFVDARGGVRIDEAAFAGLLALPCRVWVVAGVLAVDHADGFRLNRGLAAAGRFLVEDLDEAAVGEVPAKGEIVVAPLRLAGVSGSPVRVLMR